jgi:hypothetical protein
VSAGPLVIGAGDRGAGDLGVGPVVACLSANHWGLNAVPFGAGAADDAEALAALWRDRSRVMVVAAAPVAGAAGAVRRRIAGPDAPPPDFADPGFAAVFAAAAAIARPEFLVIFTVEGKGFAPPEGLSPGVAEAAHYVCKRIVCREYYGPAAC